MELAAGRSEITQHLSRLKVLSMGSSKLVHTSDELGRAVRVNPAEGTARLRREAQTKHSANVYEQTSSSY